jgi:LPXTG-site transpeptidase (sortase) family protein
MTRKDKINQGSSIHPITPLRLIFFGLVILTLFSSTTPVRAIQADEVVVINVTTMADEFVDGSALSGCSLREAIQAANQKMPFGGCTAGGAITVIYVPQGMYILSKWGSQEDGNVTGDLDIYNDVTITGFEMENTIIMNGVVDRVFDIHAGTVKIAEVWIAAGSTPSGEPGGAIRNFGTLTLDHVTVTGSLTGGGIYGGDGGDGGGIYNMGALNLLNSTVSYNETGFGGSKKTEKANGGNGGRGGGLFSGEGSSLKVIGSTIVGNTTGMGGGGSPLGGDAGDAGSGGGIYNQTNPVIVNSTITTNSTGPGGEASNGYKGNAGSGGGIYNDGGIMEIEYATIVWNGTNVGLSKYNPKANGGGLFNTDAGTVRIMSTIIAGNATLNKGRDCYGTLYSLDYNLIKYDDDCTVIGNTKHNFYNQDPKLGLLKNNTGPTYTHALEYYSPIMDVIPLGVNGCGSMVDQRGASRPQDAACDIGAMEGGDDINKLPDLGFAPGVTTKFSVQSPGKQYGDMGQMILEIPTLGVSIPVVGVPVNGGEWDVSWLGNQAGYLEGTAFPTWKGNSVISGHVYLQNGLPGPFSNLEMLKWGDKINIHSWEQDYVYEVRGTSLVQPDDLSVLDATQLPWVTLVTCKGYDPVSDSYQWRVVVKAVQVQILGED